LAAALRARKSTLADNPHFIHCQSRLSFGDRAISCPRVVFETALKDLMHSALASQTFLNPANLQLRRTQQRRKGAGRFEPIATIFWALASLIAASVAAFA
jgi:hypothetical protein